jgi:hypothetical protein
VFLSFLLYYAKSLHHHSLMVGIGAKRQNIRDNNSMQHFRSHFRIGPGVIVAIIANTKNDQAPLDDIVLAQIVQDRAFHVRKMGVR